MLDTLTIRTASPADLADVEALLARVYPRSLSAHYPPSVMVTAVPLIARARPGLLASGRYYVAVTEAGALVGAGGWSLRRGVAPADDMAEVRHVVTCDRMQRRGIGRAVLTRILAAARGAGIRRIGALATRGAVPFYAVMGFVEGPEVAVPLAPGVAFPAVQMMRQI